jgi:hypothetical protein
LGYIAHLTCIFSNIYNITLKYSVIPSGSRSFIKDEDNNEKILLPLFIIKGKTDKLKLTRAILLLNLNILHIIKNSNLNDELVNKHNLLENIYFLINGKK